MWSVWGEWGCVEFVIACAMRMEEGEAGVLVLTRQNVTAYVILNNRASLEYSESNEDTYLDYTNCCSDVVDAKHANITKFYNITNYTDY